MGLAWVKTEPQTPQATNLCRLRLNSLSLEPYPFLLLRDSVTFPCYCFVSILLLSVGGYLSGAETRHVPQGPAVTVHPPGTLSTVARGTRLEASQAWSRAPGQGTTILCPIIYFLADSCKTHVCVFSTFAHFAGHHPRTPVLTCCFLQW